MSVRGLLEDQGKMKNDGLSPEYRSIVDNMLQHFNDVFEEPKGLSPVHMINLKLGQEPINVRPYHYAYNKKNEIEK